MLKVPSRLAIPVIKRAEPTQHVSALIAPCGVPLHHRLIADNGPLYILSCEMNRYRCRQMRGMFQIYQYMVNQIAEWKGV